MFLFCFTFLLLDLWDEEVVAGGVVGFLLTKEERETVRELVAGVRDSARHSRVSGLPGVVRGGFPTLVHGAGIRTVHQQQLDLTGLTRPGSNLRKIKKNVLHKLVLLKTIAQI